MKVTVIDYGLSNLLSVRHAFAHFGAETLLTSDPADVLAAEKLVLPGVGAFKDGMDGLARLGLIEPIRQKAAAGTPLLGICLGMQMLFDESEEFGLHKGLGLIPGRVVKIPDTDVDGHPQKVPHISWDPLYPGGGRTDFSGTALAALKPGEECYFIHSYEAKPVRDEDRLADTVYGGREMEICGGEAATTNNRMELTAVIEGFKALKRPCDVTLYTDSKYVADAITKGWAEGWKRKGWKKSDGKPALNSDLWDELLTLISKHSLNIVWLKGHAGHPENERCDELATTAADDTQGKGLLVDEGFTEADL